MSRVDAERLWADVEGLAAITDPDRPYTRRAFTPRFLAGRAFLRERFEAAGLEVRLDAGGNLIGRREGRRAGAKTLAVGSHSDTVPAGGRFDGIAGVLAGLEAIRALGELDHPVEAIDFLAEEPNVYGSSCVGSRAMAGALPPAMLEGRDEAGETLAAAIARMGGDPARIEGAVRDDVAAYLELHIEQGPVLETTGTDLGVVTDIVGIVRYEIVFDGQADHAGTTPMDVRSDALVAAAATVSAVRRLAVEASAGAGYFVATTGRLAVEPNAANVVPSRATMTVEARASEEGALEAFVAALDEASRAAAAAAGVTRASFLQKSHNQVTRCDPRLRAVLKDCARGRNVSAIDLASGAGHDAMFVARLAPMAMAFIPCAGGRSHCPEEWADRTSLAAGAQLLCDALARLDAEP